MKRIDQIFDEAIELQGQPLDQFLSDNCPTPEDRLRVEALLSAHHKVADFLEEPAVGAADTDQTQMALTDTKANGAPEGLRPLLHFLDPPLQLGNLGRIGIYEIESIVGKGGMGVVLLATDTRLKRRVAIKVLNISAASFPGGRKKFLREAQSVARISHPNVVAVYFVEEGENPYIVMEYVEGENLQDRLKRNPLTVNEILHISRQAAAGFAAAHAENLVHRDIKPANILLDLQGDVKVTDFGLAKTVEEGDTFNSCEISGTPQFMSPEQSLGDSMNHRSDIFSLGSVMYTMCTGKPAFVGDTTLDVLHAVRDAAPLPLSEQRADIPAALAQLIHQLMSKSPAQRPESMNEIVERLDDIQCELNSGTTAAKPEVPKRKLPLRFAGIAAMLLVLLAISELTGMTAFSGYVAQVIRIRTPEGALLVEVDDPDIKVTIDGDELIIGDDTPREIRLKIGDYQVKAERDGKVVHNEIITISDGEKRRVSLSYKPDKPDAPTTPAPNKAATTSPVTSPIRGEPKSLIGHTHFVLHIAYSPDGTKLASCQFGGKVKMWDVINGNELFEVRYKGQRPERVRFSPDGTRVALGEYCWDANSGRQLPDYPDPVLEWSPDGKLRAGRYRKTQVRLRDSNNKIIRTIDTNLTLLRDVSFSKDGKWLATCGLDHVKIWDVETGERLVQLVGHKQSVASCRFSPDKTVLITTAEDQTAILWDLKNIKEERNRILHRLLGHGDRVQRAFFINDGKTVVTCSNEGAVTFPGKPRGKTIKFWDVATGRETWNQSGHRHNVTWIELRGDKKQFATSSYDQSIRLWDLK